MSTLRKHWQVSGRTNGGIEYKKRRKEKERWEEGNEEWKLERRERISKIKSERRSEEKKKGKSGGRKGREE